MHADVIRHPHSIGNYIISRPNSINMRPPKGHFLVNSYFMDTISSSKGDPFDRKEDFVPFINLINDRVEEGISALLR